MNDATVLDMSTESHHTVLDDPVVTCAVPAAPNEAGSGGFRVAVVAHKDHSSVDLELSTLAVRTEGTGVPRPRNSCSGVEAARSVRLYPALSVENRSASRIGSQLYHVQEGWGKPWKGRDSGSPEW
ncbi:hypothetical protein HYDPIDRAFT_120505 [Hydnomerulius pinastri MD-312]|uniref:Uncharacterized protein n=1 Tax=Hydnomerulius pinastri MD-312 TaxID=994086 RepID=A0A0C9VWM5_9AGAM|nr:hypothetical protein HYDPIDRAFT_120505 [Hydnomerulius pinastri MD-312]